MDRRSVVVGLAAVGGSAGLALGGCGSGRDGATTGAGPTDEEADRRLVATALGAELTLVDALERTRRRHPLLRGVTAEALRIHRNHVRLLRGAVDAAASAPPGPTRVPGRPVAAVRALVRLERETADAHVSTAMAARSGSLARVVATLSVAAAQLEQVLAGDAAPGGGS